jgi:hypothetical protein
MTDCYSISYRRLLYCDNKAAEELFVVQGDPVMNTRLANIAMDTHKNSTKLQWDQINRYGIQYRYPVY